MSAGVYLRPSAHVCRMDVLAESIGRLGLGGIALTRDVSDVSADDTAQASRSRPGEVAAHRQPACSVVTEVKDGRRAVVRRVMHDGRPPGDARR